MTNTERFLKKVTINYLTGCWDWHGAKTGTYGQYGGFRFEGKLQNSHRVAWQLWVGPIPAGMTIDHKCRNTLCQNTDHMELATRGINSNRGNGPTGLNSRKTHCSKGHEFTDANTYITPQGWRNCISCQRIKEKTPKSLAQAAARQVKYRARKKEIRLEVRKWQ